MLGESAQMWSESAIPRVATCLEDEEIVHFDLSRFLCLARTDKQMVGRTSFNHVQTPLTFDNVSRILFFAGRTSFGSPTVSCLGHHQRRREKPSEIRTRRETSRGLEECSSLGVACHPMLPPSQSILRGGTEIVLAFLTLLCPEILLKQAVQKRQSKPVLLLVHSPRLSAMFFVWDVLGC